MNRNAFTIIIVLAAAAFLAAFCSLVIPAFAEQPDLVAAFAAGFDNPFASGYSADVIACWVILAAWVAFESKNLGVRHGWVCCVLGIVPGVAVGFALYLVLRLRQL